MTHPAIIALSRICIACASSSDDSTLVRDILDISSDIVDGSSDVVETELVPDVRVATCPLNCGASVQCVDGIVTGYRGGYFDPPSSVTPADCPRITYIGTYTCTEGCGVRSTCEQNCTCGCDLSAFCRESQPKLAGEVCTADADCEWECPYVADDKAVTNDLVCHGGECVSSRTLALPDFLAPCPGLAPAAVEIGHDYVVHGQPLVQGGELRKKALDRLRLTRNLGVTRGESPRGHPGLAHACRAQLLC